jgi:rhomboid protease GluP
VTDATPTEESIAAVEASLDDAAAAPEPQRRARSLSLWNYPATYTLLGINLLVYAAMFAYGPVPGMLHQHDLAGVLTASFNIDTLVRFGATNSQLVLAGQWWRLVTGTFVHLNMLHIALNMWCLWNLGLFGEPLLGRRGLVVVYLLTGTAGYAALRPCASNPDVPGRRSLRRGLRHRRHPDCAALQPRLGRSLE